MELQHLLQDNQKICDRIVQVGLDYYAVERSELDEHIKRIELKGQKADKTSVSQALKHIVRDWTVSGSRERDNTFSCLLGVLEGLFPDREAGTTVLVPGAGLGRLAHDIAGMNGKRLP